MRIHHVLFLLVSKMWVSLGLLLLDLLTVEKVTQRDAPQTSVQGTDMSPALDPVAQGPVPGQQPPRLPVNQLLEVEKTSPPFLLDHRVSSQQQSSCLTCCY